MTPRSVAFLALALAAIACNKHESSASSAGATSATAAAAASSAATAASAAKPAGTATKLAQIGLTAELPEFASAGDGMTKGSVMVIGSAPVNISPARPDDPKTVDAAKKHYADFKPTNFKSETLPDGWLLTFENTGSAGTNYWMEMRRTIGGKDFVCDTSVSHESQREGAIAVCKSLKP